MLAYLDAGTGSMITQAVVAGTAGVAVAAKLGWKRVTTPFRKKDADVVDGASGTAEDAAAHGDDK